MNASTCPVRKGGDRSDAGYLHQRYAASLAEFGSPCLLPRSGGWILERAIPGFDRCDAMGCYPLFCCRDWSGLGADLDALAGRLVSLAIVVDPFGDYEIDALKRCFRDVVHPFKMHYIADLEQPLTHFVHPHHRRNARWALRRLSVERCADPSLHLDEWVGLYANLIQRHRIRGVTAFGRASFALQLAVPGLTMFRAVHEERTVGMTLWYTQGGIAYSHLAAYSDVGYRHRASYALFWRAFEHFAASGVRWINLGAGAGVTANPQDGLTHFKQGWSTGTRTAYFCGRVLDSVAYERAIRASGVLPTPYFPAYRDGEFGNHQPGALR